MAKTHLRIVVRRIHCGNTESIHGPDALYLSSALSDGSPTGTQASMMSPTDINDGHNIWPDHVLFDGHVDEDAVVRGGITAWDEDYAKDWAKKPEWVKKAKDAIVDKLKASGNPIAEGAGQILKWGYDVFDFFASKDKDDELGSVTISVEATGPAREEITRKFSKEGDVFGYSSWNYSMYLEVQRPNRFAILRKDVWPPGWSHFMAYAFLSGPTYFIVYNWITGDVIFNDLTDGGTATKTLASGKWATGWTRVTTFSLGLERFLLVYNWTTGAVRIDRLRKNGTGSDNVWAAKWAPGWSIIEPIGGGNTAQPDHLLVYNPASGKVRVDRFNSGGTGTTNVFDGSWAAGWTSLMPYRLATSEWRFMVYNSKTGLVHFNQFDNPALGTGNIVGTAKWAPGWTHFVPYPKHLFSPSAGHRFLAYNTATGTVHFDRLTDEGHEILEAGTWAKGWTSFCPLLLTGEQGATSQAGMIAYNAKNGEVHADRL